LSETLEARPAPRSNAVLAFLLVIGGALFAGFVALGSWQVQRLFWKLDLIERVEARVHAEPVAPPDASAWARVDAAHDEYRAVRITGEFLHEREALVQAVTERGPGFWVLTPLRTTDGHYLLINRGFVEADRRDPATRPQGQVSGTTVVTGLLRLSEPGGGFLRDNDAAADRWYSRDVAAIAAARELPAQQVAPYFIDADASPNAGGWPVGGLTIVKFHNSHLVYAITWFSLALMVIGAGVIVWRRERRIR
jgi:surfeit locus 1 family protein